MINIKAKTLSEAWRKSLAALAKTSKTDDPELEKNDILLAEISSPLGGGRFDNDFPMSQRLMEEYNNFILKGGEKGNVLHEHALYHERIFCFPPSCRNQIDAVVAKLKSNPFSKRAQISLWNPDIDPESTKVPCIQIIWFRIENKKLVMHVHMRACDAYKKFLMNINICASLMAYIAKLLNVEPGDYVHFVDSFHIYKEDFEKVAGLAENEQA